MKPWGGSHVGMTNDSGGDSDGGILMPTKSVANLKGGNAGDGEHGVIGLGDELSVLMNERQTSAGAEEQHQMVGQNLA